MSELTHQQRVAANFEPRTIAHKVALYHDHLEDSLGAVPPEILPLVSILTRWPDERYYAYIARIRDSGNGVARAVKIADLRDNLARCRGEHDGEVNPRRAHRYETALAMLSAPAAAAVFTREEQ